MSETKAEAGDGQTPEQILSSDKLNELDLNDLIVETKHMSFTYDTKKGNLLSNINMTFPRSAIYGFLGPSGCGKTTIIKLIIGQLKPAVGSIRINGKSQSDPSNKIPGVGIGYMPQEYALYNEFTIMETLNYFAKIYGLSSDSKKKRIDFLIKFLELPDPNRMVDVLSGGQKRRTSLAVALIHNPPLLIMDEPTVGVDPMLRERIWQHLVELSATEKTSIMITTHYIEECRRAHVIALMRGGHLLVENSPTVLLKHFKTNNLEDVFLQVCKFEEQTTTLKLPPNLAKVRETKLKSKKSGGTVPVNKKVWTNSSFVSTFRGRYLALVLKNVNRLYRQKLVFFVQILTPILCGVLICITFGKKPFDLNIAVFNGETVGVEKGSTGSQMSLKLLNNINNKTIILENYNTRASALNSVRDGRTFGALIIHKEFSSALTARALAENFEVSDDVINNSTIRFYADTTDLMIFQAMFQTLIDAEFAFKKQMIKETVETANTKLIDPIISFVDPPVYGSLNPNFRDFAAPGFILLVVYLFSNSSTALEIVGEKVEGTLNRTLVAGVKLIEIILALITIQFIVLIIQSISLIAIIYIFDVKNEGDVSLIMSLLLIHGSQGMAFGLLLSSFSHDELMAFVLTNGSFLPFLIISGVIWPLEGMHYILRTISLFTPQTLPILSLRNIMLKGWGLGHTLVWSGFIVSFGYLLFFILLATIFSSLLKD